MKEKRNKIRGNLKPDPAVLRYTVRFNEKEHNRFSAVFEKLGAHAKSVSIRTHFFGQPFRVLKVDRTLVDYYTRLSDSHAQFRVVGTNYNQVVRELRLRFSEKKAMVLFYKLEQQTVEFVKLSRQIVELSREIEVRWSQKLVQESRCTARPPTTGKRSTRRKGIYSLPTASTMTARGRWTYVR